MSIATVKTLRRGALAYNPPPGRGVTVLRVSFLCAFTATGAGLCVLIGLKLARANGLL